MRRCAPSDTRRDCADVSGLKTAPGRHPERDVTRTGPMLGLR